MCLFVYTAGIEHARCDRTYEKVGCFLRFSRKMFDILVMTDRDWSADQYGGQDIDWFNWAEYIHG